MSDPKLSSLAHQDGAGWGSARACETRHLPPTGIASTAHWNGKHHYWNGTATTGLGFPCPARSASE